MPFCYQLSLPLVCRSSRVFFTLSGVCCSEFHLPHRTVYRRPGSQHDIRKLAYERVETHTRNCTSAVWGSGSCFWFQIIAKHGPLQKTRPKKLQSTSRTASQKRTFGVELVGFQVWCMAQDDDERMLSCMSSTSALSQRNFDHHSLVMCSWSQSPWFQWFVRAFPCLSLGQLTDIHQRFLGYFVKCSLTILNASNFLVGQQGTRGNIIRQMSSAECPQ